MKKVALTELAHVIRSKNSGPFELTFDIIFKDDTAFTLAVNSGVFTPALFAGLYKIPEEEVLGVIQYPPAKAIKATIVRPRPAGSLGETDVYGAQQHAPLLTIQVPVEEEED
jgi:hypothetical protein